MARLGGEGHIVLRIRIWGDSLKSPSWRGSEESEEKVCGGVTLYLGDDATLWILICKLIKEI